MPRRLKYKEEFYEAYKLHIRGFATGQIRASFENPLMETSSKIDAKTINNWRRKYGDKNFPIDEAWHWSKSDEYENWGLPYMSSAEIEKNSDYYWEYMDRYGYRLDKFNKRFPLQPSVREMKYINLLFVLGNGAWDMDVIMERARDYARTEFCVEIGEYEKEAMEKHNEELDMELFYRKYLSRREARKEDDNES